MHVKPLLHPEKTSHASKTAGRAYFSNDDPVDVSSQKVCNILRYNTYWTADCLGKQSATLRWEEGSMLVKKIFKIQGL